MKVGGVSLGVGAGKIGVDEHASVVVGTSRKVTVFWPRGMLLELAGSVWMAEVSYCFFFRRRRLRLWVDDFPCPGGTLTDMGLAET